MNLGVGSAAGRGASEAAIGATFALAAFSFWGLAPIYFKLVDEVPPLEVLAQRIVWSVPLLALLVTLGGWWGRIRAALTSPRTLPLLGLSTLLISVNWFVFIYAIDQERVIEISLGYYVNPLVNVLLGFAVLRERLLRLQWLAVLLAAAGVANMAFQVGALPWISLFLAFSFGLYGLVRKMTPLGSAEGLFCETLLVSPLALGFVVYLWVGGGGHFLVGDLRLDLLLPLAGLVTALPLVWFGSAARRLSLATVGFFQYLAPSIQFLLAVFLYGEPFGRAHLVTFGCIWGALALFTFAGLSARRRKREAES